MPVFEGGGGVGKEHRPRTERVWSFMRMVVVVVAKSSLENEPICLFSREVVLAKSAALENERVSSFSRKVVVAKHPSNL